MQSVSELKGQFDIKCNELEQARSELESTQLELEDAKRTLRLEKTSLIEQESQVAAIEVLRNKLSKEKEKV